MEIAGTYLLSKKSLEFAAFVTLKSQLSIIGCNFGVLILSWSRQKSEIVVFSEGGLSKSMSPLLTTPCFSRADQDSQYYPVAAGAQQPMAREASKSGIFIGRDIGKTKEKAAVSVVIGRTRVYGSGEQQEE